MRDVLHIVLILVLVVNCRSVRKRLNCLSFEVKDLCPDGFMSYLGSCLQKTPKPSFEYSKEWCVYLGGTLALVKDMEKMNFIADCMATSYDELLLIGAKKYGHAWYWPDQTQLMSSSNLWYQDEPFSHLSFDCVAITVLGKKPPGIRTVLCDGYGSAVCEIPDADRCQFAKGGCGINETCTSIRLEPVCNNKSDDYQGGQPLREFGQTLDVTSLVVCVLFLTITIIALFVFTCLGFKRTPKVVLDNINQLSQSTLDDHLSLKLSKMREDEENWIEDSEDRGSAVDHIKINGAIRYYQRATTSIPTSFP